MFRFLRRRKSPDNADTVPTASAKPAAIALEQLLAQLSWRVIKRLDGQLQGDYRTLFRGSGVELADLREYQPHDDVRHIDWNVTARIQTPYVRQHQEDREMTAYFLLDLSGSIGFGSASVTKRNLAVASVAVLARILTRRGNPVGAMLYGTNRHKADRVLPARTGKTHVLELMQAISTCAPPKLSQMTDLRLMLLQAQRYCKRRSTVFVVSDFISDPGWDNALRSLAHRHEVIAIRLQDPWEMELPAMGLFTIEDSETGEQILMDANHKGFRERFAQLAQQREQTLQKIFQQAHVDCLTLQTDTDLGQSLLEFMLMRKKRFHSGAALRKATSTA